MEKVIVSNRSEVIVAFDCSSCGQVFEAQRSAGGESIHPVGVGCMEAFTYLEACRCGNPMGVYARDILNRRPERKS